jgi:hypothetical protein
MDLEKEVVARVKEGKTKGQIIDELTSQGYSISSVKAAISVAYFGLTDKPKAHEKLYTIIGVVAIIVMLVIIGSVFLSRDTSETSEIADLPSPYEQEPLEWLDVSEDKVVALDIAEATEDLGEIKRDTLQIYLPDGDIHSIMFFGYHNDTHFSEKYYDTDGIVKMKISSELKPGDGVLDAFAILKHDDVEPKIYLYLDKDWLDLGKENINIIWGSNLQNSSSVHTRAFDFSNKKNGVYVDVLDYDLNWYKELISKGGIWFGDVTFEEFASDDYSGEIVIVR